jgi:dienelactone hydrolase
MSVSQSLVSFASGGKSIRLDCFQPARNGRCLPTVIALYGSGGGHVGLAEPASLLAEQGFAVYVLHYFDRTGTTEANRQIIFRNFPTWMRTLWDAISFVVRQPCVDAGRLGLLGFSLGAYLSLSTAAIDSRIAAVVEFSGGLPKEMNFFMRRLCPVLILHGEADSVVPLQEAYQLRELLQRKGIEHEIHIYPGVGHGFNGETGRDAGLRAVTFLAKHLRSSSC